MLYKFSATNFKTFKDVEIYIKPITIIVGPNNSGKSSLIQAINLIQQTLLRNPNNYMFNTISSDGAGEQTVDAGSFKEIINQSTLIHAAEESKMNFKLWFTESYVQFSLKWDGDTTVYVSDFLCTNGDIQYSLNNLEMNDYNKTDFNLNNTNKFEINLERYLEDKDISKIELNPKIYREGFFSIFHL